MSKALHRNKNCTWESIYVIIYTAECISIARYILFYFTFLNSHSLMLYISGTTVNIFILLLFVFDEKSHFSSKIPIDSTSSFFKLLK